MTFTFQCLYNGNHVDVDVNMGAVSSKLSLVEFRYGGWIETFSVEVPTVTVQKIMARPNAIRNFIIGKLEAPDMEMNHLCNDLYINSPQLDE